MTTLYVFIWYPELNKKIAGVSQDIVVRKSPFRCRQHFDRIFYQTAARFRAVTIFQRLDWNAQAHILPVDYAKCFVGWVGTTGTEQKCKDPPHTTLVPGQACDCRENWSSPVVENFMWHNTSYRYLSFTPSVALISSFPTLIMTLQVFFNCKIPQIHHARLLID